MSRRGGGGRGRGDEDGRRATNDIKNAGDDYSWRPVSQSQGINIYESARSVQSMGRSHRCDSHQSVRLEAALLQRHTTPAKHLLLLRLHCRSFQLQYTVTKPGLTLITSLRRQVPVDRMYVARGQGNKISDSARRWGQSRIRFKDSKRAVPRLSSNVSVQDSKNRNCLLSL